MVEERLLFTRRSTLWDLEYWKDLDLMHNLDVMHIEKNICDSIIGTPLNIEGKTKDTLKSRIDLTHLGIKRICRCKMKVNHRIWHQLCTSWTR